MTQRQTGWIVAGIAMATLLMNLSDAVGDMQNFHGDALWSPAFVSIVMKQVGAVMIAALSGRMLAPQGEQK